MNSFLYITPSVWVKPKNPMKPKIIKKNKNKSVICPESNKRNNIQPLNYNY